MGLIWYGDGMSQSPFISISGFNILRIPQPVIFSLNQFKSHFLFIQFIFISNKLNITMEIGKEQVGSSSSSLTEDLSAPKDSSQSPGIFSLLFPPLVRRPSSNSSSYLMECLDKQLYEFNFKHGRKNHKACYVATSLRCSLHFIFFTIYSSNSITQFVNCPTPVKYEIINCYMKIMCYFSYQINLLR
ncbi:unnamed protein product [Cuscuta epithymum]|uniref:Uncharacterized protein n=1 Tax=Cuscuta epithymum TaxID=186058 RepID=A0AAV0F128_9ASTE|nr:unnamed protein product [Cuscuta epithymum]